MAQAVRGDSAPSALASSAVSGAAVVLGAWALARELALDDQPAAFVSMALAFATHLLVDAPSLLLLFTAMLLVRSVTRSVGLPLRVTDSLAVVGMVAWATVDTRSPALAVVGALGFSFDAVLHDPQRRQWIVAGCCLAVAGWAGAVLGPGSQGATPLTAVGPSVVVFIGAPFVLTILRSRHVVSTGDATGIPLSPVRVRAGMLVGLITAVQAGLSDGGVATASLVWAALAGVAVGRARTVFLRAS